MENLRQLGIPEAIEVILADVSGHEGRLRVAKSLVKAVKESDRDDQGRSLFGSDSVVGAYLLRQGYGARVIGSGCDESLQEKVYGPLGFSLVTLEGQNGVTFYGALGKSIRERY